MEIKIYLLSELLLINLIKKKKTLEEQYVHKVQEIMYHIYNLMGNYYGKLMILLKNGKCVMMDKYYSLMLHLEKK